MTATKSSVAGLYVGASGFSYPSWKPGFYPADARPEEFLPHYAKRLPSVELNTTGYRLPAEGLFDRWASAVPDGFRFAVKLSPRGFRELATFEERVRRLGDRLGPIRAVVQTARDDGFLEFVLGSADPELRYAFDFGHDSWDGPDVDERLAAAGAVRVGAKDTRAGFVYLRFRDPPYEDAQLESFADSIRPLLAAGADVFAYFRHEDEPTAPRYAERLRGLVEEGTLGGRVVAKECSRLASQTDVRMNRTS
jgi:uncharacterized protein YecE (DUF72 family)